MTFTYLILLKAICLNIFPEYLNFIHITFKQSISSNHIKHFKRLMLCYVLLLFIILKSSYLMGQPPCLKNDFSSKKRLFCMKRLNL